MKKAYEKPDLEVVILNTGETLNGAVELSNMPGDNPFDFGELE